MSAIIVVLNKVVPNPYNGQRDQVKQVLDHPNKWKSLTFGRSHAYSLNYDYYDKPGMNFALGGRDLASIEYLLDHFLPVCDSLEEVVLFISYTSLYFDNTAMSSGNLNDARKALYYSVPSMRPINLGDINNFIFGKFFTFIQADHGWQMIKDAMSRHVENSIESASTGNLLTEDEMEESGEKQSLRDILDRRNATSYNPYVNKDNEKVLRSIVTKCKANHIRVRMIQAPYFHTYVERVPLDMIEEIVEVVKKISNDYKIEYNDYSCDSAFTNNLSFFSNADHLNKEGQKAFTSLLKEQYSN